MRSSKQKIEDDSDYKCVNPRPNIPTRIHISASTMTEDSARINVNYPKATLAVLAGMALNFGGDWLIGANVEVFKGIETFSFPWILDVFFLPFGVGLLTAKVYGSKGGKWLACLPPLFVRCLTYVYLYLFAFNDGRDFFYHLNLYYWGPVVILVVEASNFGGILGEVLIGAYRKKASNSAAESDAKA